MSIRARLVFDVDDARRMLTVKYFGDLDSHTISETLTAEFQKIEQAWLYDALFDMRRFEGVVVLDDLAQMTRAWNQAARGRDAGRLTAIVSSDPLTHARQKAYEAGLPLRIVRTFNELTEAEHWLEAMRNATDPKLAS